MGCEEIKPNGGEPCNQSPRALRDGSSAACGALAHRFVKAYGAGHADVEAFHRTQHGNVHQFVAGFACKAPHALAFGAHDPCHGAASVDAVHAALGLVVGAYQPDVPLFQLAHGTCQVGHHDVGHGVGRA